MTRAKSWYREAFGIQPHFDGPSHAGFDVGGYELGLDPNASAVTVGNDTWRPDGDTGGRCMTSTWWKRHWLTGARSIGLSLADRSIRMEWIAFGPDGFSTRRRSLPRPGVSVLLLTLLAVPADAQKRSPIIDMHLHALAADDQGPPPVGICTPIDPFPAWDPAAPYGATFMAMLKQPPCGNPVWSPMSDQALMQQTIEVMTRHRMVGVLSGTPERVAAWMAAAPGRFYPGLGFRLGREAMSPDALRALHAKGSLAVLAEITNQYAGIAPDDERMQPYWALAEELEIPVGIHVGTGPPGAIYLGAAGYRARLHSALTLEEVLGRHPRLRVYVMHAGFPMLDDMLAVLYAHPQVYVEVGVIVYTQPRPAFYRYLQRIVEAGFGNRVMFGSDQMVWPGAIERAIAVIDEAPFLAEPQKRAIFYDNAARFLRLDSAEIARHRGL